MCKKMCHYLWVVMLFVVMAAHAQTQYPQLTDIPTIYINTEDGQDITSKDVYIYCTLVYRDGDSLAIYERTQIRGRGNSTWTTKSAKKPYRIKFAVSQKFLGQGYAKNKSWTLLANSGDRSMLRNALTHDLGEFVKMDFSPAARFVDLYINNKYRGTYLISDHVNVDNKRVEVDEDTGFLLEYSQDGGKSEPPHFQGKYGWVDVKNPDPPTDEQMSFVQNYITDTRDRLLNNSFTTYADPRNGYRAKVDTTSLIKWYVASEITTNWDAMYSVKAYMERDSTLCFGPLWDEDLGWNNNNEKDLLNALVAEETWVSFNSNYRPLTEATRKLWKDPWFANAVTMKLNQLANSGIKDFLLHKVDSLAAVINQSQALNYKINENGYKINESGLDDFDRYHSYSKYSQYVDQLKDLINKRIDNLLRLFADRNKNNRYVDENVDLPIKAESGVNVVVRRTAKAGVWTTVCLPFTLTDSEAKRMFGSGVRVATLSGVSGGMFAFRTQSSGAQMNAGTPYIVKPSLDVDVPFSFQNVRTTANASTTNVIGNLFVGTFKPGKLNTDELTYALNDEGNLYHPSVYDNPMPGFRAYLTTSSVADIKGFTVDGVEAGQYVVMPLLGDINQDGMVSIEDVTLLVDIINGFVPENFNRKQADLNGDGKISKKDANLLIEKLMGK